MATVNVPVKVQKSKIANKMKSRIISSRSHLTTAGASGARSDIYGEVIDG